MHWKLYWEVYTGTTAKWDTSTPHMLIRYEDFCPPIITWWEYLNLFSIFNWIHFVQFFWTIIVFGIFQLFLFCYFTLTTPLFRQNHSLYHNYGLPYSDYCWAQVRLIHAGSLGSYVYISLYHTCRDTAWYLVSTMTFTQLYCPQSPLTVIVHHFQSLYDLPNRTSLALAVILYFLSNFCTFPFFSHSKHLLLPLTSCTVCVSSPNTTNRQDVQNPAVMWYFSPYSLYSSTNCLYQYVANQKSHSRIAEHRLTSKRF